MKRVVTLAGICLLSLSAAGLLFGADKKTKPGPLTGTWECTAHGMEQGDMAFTLTLEQNQQDITGSVSSPMGGTEITSGTFKNKAVEIHINTPQGNYTITGKLKKDLLSGEWSSDSNQKGTWEGKKAAPAKSFFLEQYPKAVKAVNEIARQPRRQMSPGAVSHFQRQIDSSSLNGFSECGGVCSCFATIICSNSVPPYFSGKLGSLS